MPNILFTPDINSDIIVISKKHCLTLEFNCYLIENTDCHIELWTNLTTTSASNSQGWTGIPFSRAVVHSQHYYLELDISHLPPGEYEYTFKYTTSFTEATESENQQQWQWYGAPGQNGKVRILSGSTTNAIQPPLSYDTIAGLQLANRLSSHPLFILEHFCTKNTAAASQLISLGQLNHPLHSYVALIRKGSTWLTPVAGMFNFHDRNPYEQWQCLLYQDMEQGFVHLFMCIGSGASDGWLSACGTTSLDLHCTQGDGKVHLLIASCKIVDRWQELFRMAVDYHEQYIKKSLTRNHLASHDKEATTVPNKQEVPPYLDTLGFCTWNAFGKDVNLKKIQRALHSFEQHGIPIHHLLIDDGWQAISSTRQMISFNTDKARFGSTLKGAIEKLKREHISVKHIGVWHTLMGYWNGVKENIANEVGGVWLPIQHQQNPSAIVGLVHDPHLFYKCFYKFLQASGVDYVKVDNQGGFQELQDAASPEMLTLWNAYRKVMVESVNLFLNGQVIHCMALTPRILFNLDPSETKKRSFYRNSDDFFPDEVGSHSWHIYANAINSLLTSQYPNIIEDWDMFQSDHPFAEYHATSRAISGGPIYLTDSPGKHNTQLVQKLIAQTRQSTFTLLRSSEPPLPAFQTVFGHPMGRRSLLCLYNTHCEARKGAGSGAVSERMLYSVCGFWNTDGRQQLGTIRLSEVLNSCGSDRKDTGDSFGYVAYIVSGLEQGKIWLLQDPKYGCFSFKRTAVLNASLGVLIEGNGSSIISFSPLRIIDTLAVACLGLIDKLNGTKAIIQTGLTKALQSNRREEDRRCIYTYVAKLSHRSSSCAFWIMPINSDARQYNYYPQQVRVDGQLLEKEKEWAWEPDKSLLKVDMLALPLSIANTDTFCVEINICL